MAFIISAKLEENCSCCVHLNLFLETGSVETLKHLVVLDGCKH